MDSMSHVTQHLHCKGHFHTKCWWASRGTDQFAHSCISRGKVSWFLYKWMKTAMTVKSSILA